MAVQDSMQRAAHVAGEGFVGASEVLDVLLTILTTTLNSLETLASRCNGAYTLLTQQYAD